MIKGKMGDIVILGLSEDNVKAFKTHGPIYISKDELKIDTDIQVLCNQDALIVDGRKCMIVNLQPGVVESLKKGHYTKLAKGEHSNYNVVIFYAETESEGIRIINEALGYEAVPPDLKMGEAVYGREENGKTVQERGKAPPGIFRKEAL